MIALIIPFMALAGLGFLVSLAVHVLALFGQVPPGGEAVMAMHIGIFLIWLPAVLVFQRTGREPGGRPSWKQALAGCPAWMRYATFGLLGYAFLNFFLGMVVGAASHQPTGSPVDPHTLRMFSGHWMAFYGAGFAILFSAFRNPSLLTAAKCPAGHPVSPSASFCPTCGVSLARAKAGA